MKDSRRTAIVVSSCAALISTVASAQNWPQYLGPGRDAKASFNAPKSWPKQLNQKWKVNVGDGVATPSLVGDKLFVFARQEGGEILHCLDAATGKEIWKSEKYDVLATTGGAAGFPGPRCSPTVADGKVVVLGTRGMLSCHDAASGKLLWRKEDFKGSLPRFFTSASPVVTDQLCIAQLGGNENGGVIAYDLASGEEKWRWAGDGPSYASPVLLTADGVKMIVAETDKKVVGLGVKDGKQLWETPFAVQGRGYNASTPVVDGNTLIYGGSGRGMTAVRITKEGDGFVAKEVWKNTDNSVQFNTPVLKNGALFGLTGNNDFFCIAKDGKTAWTAPLSPQAASAPAPANAGEPTGNAPATASAGASPGTNAQASAQGGQGGQGRGGRGGRGGPPRGYGQIVDAGSVMLALTPATSELIAFQPSEKSYTEIARIKVADSPTYAYPVVSGKRIFVKDKDDVTLFTVD